MGTPRQTAITSIAKAATLTATGVPLAGEVVAMALGAILDEKDRQLEQLKEIQADTQALLHGPYNAGMYWLEQAAANYRSDEDRRHFIENAKAKFIDAASQEHDLFHKALAEYQVGNCWTFLESNEEARVNFQRAHALALEYLGEKKRALLARGREYSARAKNRSEWSGAGGAFLGSLAGAFLAAMIGVLLFSVLGVVGALLGVVLVIVGYFVGAAVAGQLAGSAAGSITEETAQNAYNRDKNEFLGKKRPPWSGF